MKLIEDLKFKWVQFFWSLQKRLDKRRKPTCAQEDLLIAAHGKAMDIFRGLQIDLDSKTPEQRRLYNMVLLYIDNEEVICSAAMRSASLIGFLETTGSGWALPPTSVPVTPEFAKEIDGYMGMEIFRNYSGIEDIHKELQAAIAKTNETLAAADAEAKP